MHRKNRFSAILLILLVTAVVLLGFGLYPTKVVTGKSNNVVALQLEIPTVTPKDRGQFQQVTISTVTPRFVEITIPTVTLNVSKPGTVLWIQRVVDRYQGVGFVTTLPDKAGKFLCTIEHIGKSTENQQYVTLTPSGRPAEIKILDKFTKIGAKGTEYIMCAAVETRLQSFAISNKSCPLGSRVTVITAEKTLPVTTISYDRGDVITDGGGNLGPGDSGSPLVSNYKVCGVLHGPDTNSPLVNSRPSRIFFVMFRQ